MAKIAKEKLYEDYVIKKSTIADLAEKYDIDQQDLSLLIDHYGFAKHGSRVDVAPIKIVNIADYYGVEDESIIDYVKQHGILPDEVDVAREDIPTKEELEELYLVDLLTIRDIADMLNLSLSFVYSLLLEYDIPRRPRGKKKL
jgi:hypothetical protein